MKIKVDNKIYDSNNGMIMVILSDQDKINIANMDANCTKYCSYPDDLDSEEVLEWMSKVD